MITFRLVLAILMTFTPALAQESLLLAAQHHVGGGAVYDTYSQSTAACGGACGSVTATLNAAAGAEVDVSVPTCVNSGCSTSGATCAGSGSIADLAGNTYTFVSQSSVYNGVAGSGGETMLCAYNIASAIGGTTTITWTCATCYYSQIIAISAKGVSTIDQTGQYYLASSTASPSFNSSSTLAASNEFIACIIFENNAVSLTSPTIGGVTATKVSNSSTFFNQGIVFYLIGGTSGSGTSCAASASTTGNKISGSMMTFK